MNPPKSSILAINDPPSLQLFSNTYNLSSTILKSIQQKPV